MSQDEQYMEVALELAGQGQGSVEPNPMVGAVIVKAGLIIGQGYHEKFGGPHAEINAIADCSAKGHDPAGATLYVTLEPCCHVGKTGPCTDAIIDAGISRVVIAMVDPSKHACGAGIVKLIEAGIDVVSTVCEKQARVLNAPFIKYARTGRCWVVAKWAQSADGKMAWGQPDAEHRWLTNEKSRKDVQRLRRRVGAILVGIETVLADDPQLTARPPSERTLTRVVLDTRLRIPLSCQLLRTTDVSPVLVSSGREMVAANPDAVDQIQSKGAEVIGCPTSAGSNLEFVLQELSRRGVQQLLVEGGPTVLTSFIEEGLVDEAAIYVAPMKLGEQGGAAVSEKMADLAEGRGLKHVQKTDFDGDTRITGLTDAGLKQIHYQ